MTSIGSRFLLFGGFDGKSTFGDFWWLVPEEDPISKRSAAPSLKYQSEDKDVPIADDGLPSTMKESQKESAVSELQRRLEVSTSISGSELHITDEKEDKELLVLASTLIEVSNGAASSQDQAVAVIRDHWRKSTASSIQLKELGPLLRDYQRLVNYHYFTKVRSDSEFFQKDAHRFYHVKNASQLRMDDIPDLLAEYKELLTSRKTVSPALFSDH